KREIIDELALRKKIEKEKTREECVLGAVDLTFLEETRQCHYISKELATWLHLWRSRIKLIGGQNQEINIPGGGIATLVPKTPNGWRKMSKDFPREAREFFAVDSNVENFYFHTETTSVLCDNYELDGLPIYERLENVITGKVSGVLIPQKRLEDRIEKETQGTAFS
ncbi:hypothetical protein Tco_0855067, partial [Tanacetum coccineum]